MSRPHGNDSALPARVRPAVRLAVAAALLLIVGAGAWWLLLRVTPAAPPGPAPERVRVGSTPPRWVPAGRPPGMPAMPRGPKGETALAAAKPAAPEQAPGHSPGHALDSGPGAHLDHYGGRSGRLAADRRPGPAEPQAQTASTGKQPELIVWLPSLRVGPEGTTLFARLRPAADERPAAVAEIAFSAGAERTPTRFRSMPPARRSDDAEAADFAWQFRPERPRPMAGAGVYTPPPEPIRYLVRVHGQLGGERFERTAGGIFYLHRPGGQLAPEPLAVERREGDLIVTTQAVIERPGSYWVYAELWGAGGERPVAFARERLVNLARGEHVVRLLFGGRVIRDSGVDGPYVVRNLRFQQVDTHPPHEAPPRAALAPTPGWKASEFH